MDVSGLALRSRRRSLSHRVVAGSTVGSVAHGRGRWIEKTHRERERHLSGSYDDARLPATNQELESVGTWHKLTEFKSLD